MDEYSFGCPRKCKRCASFAEAKLRLVPPFFKEGSGLRLMLVGQDPTVRRGPERVKHALMLDDPNSQLSRWLRGEVLGEDNFNSVTLYATNLVKCAFEVLPSAAPQGAVEFLAPYFDKCRDYLFDEVSRLQPTLVLTLGEPAHKLFMTILDNRHDFAEDMKDAFTGEFARAKLRGTEFDYSPCLHIQTFRVAGTYGERLRGFKRGLAVYFERGEINIPPIVLEWSEWVPWAELKVDARYGTGVKVPNKVTGVYEVKHEDGEQRLTIGKASDLRMRIKQGLVRGKVPHSAGERIRANEDVSRLVVRWAITDRPAAVEEELHRRYRDKFGIPPKHVKHT